MKQISLLVLAALLAVNSFAAKASVTIESFRPHGANIDIHYSGFLDTDQGWNGKLVVANTSTVEAIRTALVAQTIADVSGYSITITAADIYILGMPFALDSLTTWVPPLPSTGTLTFPSGSMATTQAASDDTTKVATTAFVQRENRSAIGTPDLAVANTETVVVQLVFPADELVAGATYMIRAYATRAGTTSAASVSRIRVGTTALTGNIAATLTSAASALAVGTVIEGLVTIRTAGSGGTVLGSLGLETHLAAVTITKSISPLTTAVAVNTTTNNIIIALTFISGHANNTFTFRNAAMWRVN